MPLHKDLTGSELHEPKGVETASTAEVYLADGVGSGDWVRVDGFGSYSDSNTSAGSPTLSLSSGTRTLLPCDASSVVEQLPSDASAALWDSSTNSHKPIRVFDEYEIRASFIAENYSSSSYVDMDLDIGLAAPILEETRPLLKSGAAQKVVLSWPVYCGTTYIANGGKFYLTYNGTGTCDIHSVVFYITRRSRNT